MAISRVESKTTSPELPFTGHQMVNAKEADPRTPGAGQWKES